MKYSNLISWSLILILVENIAYECIKLFRDVKKKEATYEKDLWKIIRQMLLAVLIVGGFYEKK